jgi:hypothetical protein
LKAIFSSVTLEERPDEYFPPCFFAGDNKRTYVAALDE